MNPAKSVIWLSLVVLVLGVAAASAGLFWTTEGAAYSFTTLHGATADIYGRGVYATDTVFKNGANRGGDVTTLVLAAPVLLLALLRYRRGSIRGAIVLLAALTHFLYVYATLALGAAYNALFLVYVAIFGCSFYAWLLLIFALLPVTSRFAPTLPARGIGVFLFVCGLLTSFLWLEPLLSALARGGVPALLGPNTTMITEALDLALVVPACYVAGVLLLRRDRRGLIFALPVLALLFFIGPTIAAMTVFQLADGIAFTLPEIVGPIGGFLVLGVINLWVVVLLLRAAPTQAPPTHAVTAQ
jgi:hypothetical protein